MSSIIIPMKHRVEINIFNTYFIYKSDDIRLRDVLDIVTRDLQTYTYNYDRLTKRTYRVLDRGYFTHDKFRGIYRFTINILNDFLLLLRTRGVVKEDIKVYVFREYMIKPLELQLDSSYVLRDYQDKYDKKIRENGVFKFVELQAGRGKSLIAMKAIITMNQVCGILIIPKYIDKWIIDIKRYTNVKDSEIYVVQGGDSLSELLTTPNHPYKFIIFSLRTTMNCIKDYEESDIVNVLPPDRIIETLGIGDILIDEAHQEFYAIFKTLLYFNPKKVIGLSATFDSSNKDTNRMYGKLFPISSRITDIVEIKKIANCFAVAYRINRLHGLRYVTPRGYNHIMLETAIMRRSMFLNDYLNMIIHYIKLDYVPRRKEGYKALIFCASIKLCTIVTNRLQALFPSYKIGRYVEDDSFDNLMNSDICISTHGK